MDVLDICEVPAGLYPIGDNALPISRPAHTVTLAAFAIAKTVVTNLQYLAFVAAGGYKDPRFWSEAGWHWQEGKQIERPDYLVDPLYNAPDQPIIAISWYEAQAYARWLALETGLPWRLPGDAEWEPAARGPHGEAPRPRNYNTSERNLGHPWAVTEAGNTSWCGALDMCGNVWEWCNTRWGRSWQTVDFTYPYHAGDGRENPDTTNARIIRGGSWFDPLPDANPANRGRYLPGSRGTNISFRLARSL